MPDEIELKLELDAGDADLLQRSALLRVEPAVTQLTSVYFDTPRQDLSKGGFSLRIRSQGNNRIQTVKARHGGAGLFVRPEWECSVDDERPKINDGSPLAELLGAAAESLAPIFTVAVERRTWLVEDGRSTIEVVLDRGEVMAGAHRSPICEVELELKRGEPAALFALARRIDGITPVRLGVLTKSERGHRLVGLPEGPAKASKAAHLGLDPGISAQRAFQVIAEACLRHYRLNEMVLLGARDADAVHQARVALRRLRSALAIFKRVVSGDRQDALRGELRWLASELGAARNLDVLLARVLPGPLCDRIASERGAAYDRLDAAIASERARTLLLDLAEWIETGAWLHASETELRRCEPVCDCAVRALDRSWRKVRKRGRHFASMDDEARHSLRKEAKTLRYAADFFGSLFTSPKERRRFKRFVAALGDLQDELGGLNDSVTAAGTLDEFGLAQDPAAAALTGADRKANLLEAAAASWADLMDAKRFWR